MQSDQTPVLEHEVTAPALPAAKGPERMQAAESGSRTDTLREDALSVTTDLPSSSVQVQAPRGLRRALRLDDAKLAEATLGNMLPDARDELGSFAKTSEIARLPIKGKMPQEPQPVVNRARALPATPDAALGMPMKTTPLEEVRPPEEVRSPRVGEPPLHEDLEKLSSKAMVPKSGMPPVMRPQELSALSNKAPDPDVQPTTSRKPTLISSAPDKDRRTRISIGRIDVQVNNQPSPLPPSPQQAKKSSRANVPDDRYVSRFVLRP